MRTERFDLSKDTAIITKAPRRIKVLVPKECEIRVLDKDTLEINIKKSRRKAET